MSRGIGQLQRRILAFAYATNKAIHGGEYVPPPGNLKPYPENHRKRGWVYIASNAIGDLHLIGAMRQIFGLGDYESASVRLGLEKGYFPDKEDPRWANARSTVCRSVSNLMKRHLLANRGSADSKQADHQSAGKVLDFQMLRFEARAEIFLTPAGVEIARNEPSMDFDFEELFGFKPKALGQMVEVTR